MKVTGWLAVGAGAIAGLFAAIMETATSTTYGETGVHNIGLMQNRDLTALLAAVLFLSGVMMIIGGSIVGAVGAGRGASTEDRADIIDAPPAQTSKPTEPMVSRLPPPPSPEEAERQRRKTKDDTIMLVVGVAVVILVILAFAAVQAGPGK